MLNDIQEQVGKSTTPHVAAAANDIEEFADSTAEEKSINLALSVNHHSTELANYVQEELEALEVELLSLEKVQIKLEFEMQRAMQTKDCELELEGLSLDEKQTRSGTDCFEPCCKICLAEVE